MKLVEKNLPVVDSPEDFELLSSLQNKLIKIYDYNKPKAHVEYCALGIGSKFIDFEGRLCEIKEGPDGQFPTRFIKIVCLITGRITQHPWWGLVVVAIIK